MRVIVLLHNTDIVYLTSGSQTQHLDPTAGRQAAAARSMLMKEDVVFLSSTHIAWWISRDRARSACRRTPVPFMMHPRAVVVHSFVLDVNEADVRFVMRSHEWELAVPNVQVVRRRRPMGVSLGNPRTLNPVAHV